MTVVEPMLTVHPPTAAHISVTPVELESDIVPEDHVYAPRANVITAPSFALLIAAWTSATEAPAGQDQVVPLPVHAACTGEAKRIRSESSSSLFMIYPGSVAPYFLLFL